MKNFKRLVGLLLCLSMVLSFVPATIVSAAESTDTTTQSATTSDVLEKIDLSGTVVGTCSQEASGTDYANYTWYTGLDGKESWRPEWKTAMVDGVSSTTLSYSAGSGERADYYLNLTGGEGGYTTVDEIKMYHGGTTTVSEVTIALVLADGTIEEKSFTPSWGSSADVDPITWTLEETCNVKGVYVWEPSNTTAIFGDIELYHYIEVANLETANLNGVDIGEYVIVYSDDQPSYTYTAAQYIQKQILLRTGRSVKIVEDATAETTYEILVGETNRSLSASTSAPSETAMKFTINANSTKVALEADYFIIAGAAYYFVDTYIGTSNFESTVPTGSREETPITKPANNYIFLIGDGMGEMHTKLFDKYGASKTSGTYGYGDGEDIFYGYYLPYFGWQKTANISGAITDSAAAGTALATGYKTINGYVGKDQYLNDVKNMSELAMEIGKSVAIMSTEGVDGATPAAYSSHSDGRYNDDEILADQKTFGGLLIDGYNNYNEFTADEYDTWEPLVKSALNSVASDPDGFFIMYEEAHIDKVSHRLNYTSAAGYTGDTDMTNLWYTVYRFNQAIALFMEYALYNPDTMVLITADHETAGLDENFEPTEQNPVDEQKYGSVWNHSLKNVPVFSYGVGAEIFDGVTAENASYARTWAYLMAGNKADDFGNPAFAIIGSGENDTTDEGQNYYTDLPEDATKVDVSDDPTFGYYTGGTTGDITEHYETDNGPANLTDGSGDTVTYSKRYTYEEIADGTKVPVILFEFDEAVNIAGIKLTGYDYSRYNIEDFDVEVYSHDGYSTSWYTAATVRDAFTDGVYDDPVETPLEIGFIQIREATKLRIIVKGITNMSSESGEDSDLETGSHIRIREIEVYETEAPTSTGITMEPVDNDKVTTTVGYYTDNNIAGEITEYYDPAYPPANLVDGETGTQTRTQNYLYDEVASGAKVPVYLFEVEEPTAFTGVQIDTYKAMYYGIEDFIVQVYTTDGEWVTATTVADSFSSKPQEEVVDPETYAFAEPLYGTKVRILVEKIWNMYDWRYDDEYSYGLVEGTHIRLREVTLMEDPDYVPPTDEDNKLKAPASLTVTDISATGITVVAPASTEYPEAEIRYSVYLNGVAIKTNNTGVFTELNPNTPYTIYAKYIGDDKTWLDSNSIVSTATTDKLPLPAPTNVEATLGTTTITVTADPVEGGTLMYRLMDENHIAVQEWQTGNQFTGLTENTQYTIQVKYDGDEDHYDSEITELTVVLGKILLSKPTLTVSATTENSITLNALAAVTGGTAEYSYSVDGTNWVVATGTVITGLNPNTKYYLRARYVATDSSYNSSLYSEVVTATTDAVTLPKPNLSATATTDSSITVTADSNANGTLMFRLAGGKWQTSGEFTGLDRNTAYTVEAMYVGTNGYGDSEVATLSVTTAKTQLSAPTGLTATAVTDTSITVTANTTTGGTLMFRINNGAWQASPTFTGLKSNTSYAVEAMYDAADDYIDSAVTTLNVTTAVPADPNAGEYAYLEAIPESCVTPHVGYNRYSNHEMLSENVEQSAVINDAMYGTVSKIMGAEAVPADKLADGYRLLSIVYDLNNGATKIGGVELTGGDYNLTKFAIQVKNTSGVWQTVKFVTNDLFDISEALRNDTVLITFTPVTGTHVRLLINGYEANENNYPEIREMVIYEVKDDARQEKKTASSGTAEVIDGNKASNYTGTEPAVLTFNELTSVKRLKLFGNTAETSIGNYTVEVQLEQGGDWTQVATGTAYSGASAYSTCNVELSTDYDVYGVRVTADGTIPEIEVYGYFETPVYTDPTPATTPGATAPTEATRPAVESPVQTSPAATEEFVVPTEPSDMTEPTEEQPNIPDEPSDMTEPTAPVATQPVTTPVATEPPTYLDPISNADTTITIGSYSSSDLNSFISTYDSTKAYRAIDGSYSSTADAVGQSLSSTAYGGIVLELDATYNIGGVEITCPDGEEITNFVIQVHNGTQWVNAHTVTADPFGDYDTAMFTFEEPISGNKLRLVIYEGNDTYPRVSEMIVYEVKSGTPLVNIPITSVSSDASPANGSSDFALDHLIDGNKRTVHETYDLNELYTLALDGAPVSISRIRLSTLTITNYAPKTVKIEVQTSSGWTTAYSGTAFSTSDKDSWVYDFEQTYEALAVRLAVSAVTDGSSLLALNEIEVFGPGEGTVSGGSGSTGTGSSADTTVVTDTIKQGTVYTIINPSYVTYDQAGYFTSTTSFTAADGDCLADGAYGRAAYCNKGKTSYKAGAVLELSQTFNIGAIEVMGDASQAFDPVDFEIQAYVNGSWTTVKTVTGAFANGIRSERYTFTPVQASGIRLYITDWEGDFCSIGEIELYVASTGSLSSEIDLTGKASTSSSINSSFSYNLTTSDINDICDGDKTTILEFTTTKPTIDFDLTVNGQPTKINSFAMFSHRSGNRPSQVKIYIKTTANGDFTSIGTFDGWSGTSYPFAPVLGTFDTIYEAYALRLEVTGNTSGSGNCYIAEFELYGPEYVTKTKLGDPTDLAATAVTENSITVSASTKTGGTLKYSLDGSNWQTSGTFSNLTAGTSYTVYAKYFANDVGTHLDSETVSIEVSTAAKAVFTVSGTVTSSGDANAEVVVRLCKDGAIVDSVTLKGNSVNYSFSDVTIGNYTLVVTKKDHTTQTAVITVSTTDVQKDIALVFKGYTVSGTVTGETDDTVTVQLYKGGAVEYTATVTPNGNNATYSFSGVEMANYTLVVTKGNHISQSKTITVDGNETVEDITLEKVPVISTTVVTDAIVGPTYNVRLYEPWALRVNVTFYEEEGNEGSAIPLSNFKSYGAYAIIAHKFGDGTTAPTTWEEIVNDPNAVQFRKAAGEGDGNMFVKSDTTAAFDYYDGLYTYRLAENVYWVAYYEDMNGVIHFTEVRSPKLMDKVEKIIGKIADDPDQDTQRIVLEHMRQLHYALLDFRGEDADLGNIYEDGKLNYGQNLGEFHNGTYQFGRSHRIRLIEPWGIMINMQVRKNGTTYDFADAADFGLIFFHDKEGVYNGKMTAQQMLARNDVYVYRQSDGSAWLESWNTNGYMGITAVYDEDIFTYEMDSELFYLPFVVDADGNYHYSTNASCMNIIDQMYTYYNNRTLKNEERLTFQAMIQLHESTMIHRKKYGK